jgi:alpha-ketoglutarate-dependent taurine dioxygenase
MLAVHEQKLIHQEKAMVNIEDVLEKRRQAMYRELRRHVEEGFHGKA